LPRPILLLIVCPALFGAVPVEKLPHARVPMRDGIHLDANVYHPPGTGRFPCILIRTPYGKGEALPPGYLSFIDHGYAVVMQDVRGRYQSEGVFDALEQEGPDGYDTLTWISRQPWANGRIGMLGGSYLGIVQWKVALLNHPNLKAIFPVVSGCDDYTDRFYSPGGAMKLGHRLLWLANNLRAPNLQDPANFQDFVYHLPLRSADKAATGQTLSLYQQVLNHPAYDAYWKRVSVRDKLDRIHLPVFSVGGWYDNYVESDLEAFSTLNKLPGRAYGTTRILIGPWPHNMSLKFAGVDFGQDSSSPVRAYQIDWFDHWLKGRPELGHHHAAGTWHEVKSEVAASPIEIFVMGVNRWRDEQEWPLARARAEPLYLSSKGHANGARGDGRLEWSTPKKEKNDSFTYDPAKPVPTVGGAVCCDPKIFPWGPLDQRGVENRNDVLVYTSKPVPRDLEVTGAIHLVAYVSSSAPDTDFTAKLVDVFPDGEARNLTDGILRLRYREGLDRPLPGHPGEIYPVTIDAGVTSNVFLKGHRIRLEISSSNFPRFDRNPNTGRTLADETTLKKAEQNVFHGRIYPSHLVLPVIPELLSAAAARYPADRRSSQLSLRAR
jgi:putative CocE/NonD family hydrolase